MEHVVYGSGSQAIYVMENLRAIGDKDPVAFVDLESRQPKHSELEGISVFGFDEAIKLFSPDSASAIVAHGSNKIKLQVVGRLKSLGYKFFSAISPLAMVSPLAIVDEGCIINAGAIILPRASIGPHVIIHSGSVVEHDCVICEGCNIAPGVTLAGRVNIGRGSYIYTGSCVAPGISIGLSAVVGAGSVVLKTIPDFGCYAGVPARPIRV